MSKQGRGEGPLHEPVTQYQLSGEDLQIVFCAGSEDTMTLEYNGQVFRGEDLARERTALGLEVTAILETIPDLHTITLTLAVPAANRPADARTVPVSTFAVYTTERTSIGGPALVSGQLREYKVIPLEGDAS